MGKKTSINTLLTYASSTGEEEESGRSGDSWSRNTRSVRETRESDEDDDVVVVGVGVRDRCVASASAASANSSANAVANCGARRNALVKWAAALWHCCSSLRRLEAVMMAWAAACGTVSSSIAALVLALCTVLVQFDICGLSATMRQSQVAEMTGVTLRLGASAKLALVYTH